jgi:hypothetical protein
MPLIENQNQENRSVSPSHSPVRSHSSHEDDHEPKAVNTPEFDRHQSRQETMPVPDSLKVNLFFEEAKSLKDKDLGTNQPASSNNQKAGQQPGLRRFNSLRPALTINDLGSLDFQKSRR